MMMRLPRFARSGFAGSRFGSSSCLECKTLCVSNLVSPACPCGGRRESARGGRGDLIMGLLRCARSGFAGFGFRAFAFVAVGYYGEVGSNLGFGPCVAYCHCLGARGFRLVFGSVLKIFLDILARWLRLYPCLNQMAENCGGSGYRKDRQSRPVARRERWDKATATLVWTRCVPARFM